MGGEKDISFRLVFVVSFFLAVFLINAVPADAVRLYMNNTAIANLGGTDFRNYTDAASSFWTSVIDYPWQALATKYIFDPAAASGSISGNPDSGTAAGYGWGTNYTLPGAIPAGSWNFSVKLNHSGASAEVGNRGFVVYKRCSGSDTRLFSTFNSTDILLGSGPATAYLHTYSGSTYSTNGCYLKVEYWLNVTTSDFSNNGPATMTHDSSSWIEFPDPSSDNEAPIITVQSPSNTTYPAISVWFNITLNETASWAGYSLDGQANRTMTNSSGNWNAQNTSMALGQHYVKFYANDTNGNMNATGPTIYFTIAGVGMCQTLSMGNTVYTLFKNIATNSTTGDTCITIGANNVTLDGNGYSITYDSWTSAGYGIDNSGGYDNITIKNVNITESSSNANAGSYPIYGVGMLNSTIFNNTIVTNAATAHGIYLKSISDSNNISGNNITTSGTDSYGILFESSDSGFLGSNKITTSNTRASGIVIAASSASNTLINNNITATGTGSYGINITSSNYNNITGGSVSGGFFDYYLENASTTNNFTATNFSVRREINFNDTVSYFSYNNDTDGNIWLKTNVSVATTLNRTLVQWSNYLVQWNDTNISANVMANYTIAGLLPNAQYKIYNTSKGTQANPYTIAADSGGNIKFNISLNGNTEIEAVLAPTVTLNSPIDNFNQTSLSITFNCTASDDMNLTNVTLYNNLSGTWQANGTNTSGINNVPYIFQRTAPSSGTFAWNCLAYNNGSISSFAPSNFTITADNSPPTSNSPADASYNQMDSATIGWILYDNYAPGYYTVYRNGTVQNQSTWTNNTNLNIWVNTTAAATGSWNYTITYNDSLGNDGTSDTVMITVNATPPTSNSPGDASYDQADSATIGWILYDDYAPGYYKVYRNGTLQNQSTWTNNTNLNIWANTTALGSWNYTITYNDSLGNNGTADTVIITVTPVPPIVVVDQWMNGFPYRIPVNISNSGSVLTDFQVNFTINTQTPISAGKMRSDCGDIRIADSDGYTDLSYWLESGCNSASTSIWVKVPSIPASGSTVIYVYYGVSTASSTSSQYGVLASPPISIWNYTGVSPSSNSIAYGVAVDSNNNALVGGVDRTLGASNGRFRIEKINSTGSNVWNYTNNTGSNDDIAYGIAVDSGDNAVIAGQDNRGGGNLAWRTEKVDSSGNYVWNYSNNPSIDDDIPYGIAVDLRNDDILVAGYDNVDGIDWARRVQKLTSSGSYLWGTRNTPTVNYVFYGIAVDSGGNATVVGYDNVPGTNEWMVRKINSSGNASGTTLIWSYSNDSSANNEEAYGVAADAWNNSIVVGSDATISAVDIRWMAVKLGPTGSVVWLYNSNPSSSADIAYGVVVDSRNDTIVAGSDTVSGNKGWRVEKINSSGSNVWSYRSDPSTNADEARGIALSKDRFCYIVAGYATPTSWNQWRAEKICERKLSSAAPTIRKGAEDSLTTPAGNATNWTWKVPQLGEKVRSGNATEWQWINFSDYHSNNASYKRTITISSSNPGSSVDINVTALIDFNRTLLGWWRFNNESGENSTFFRDWSTYGTNGSCPSNGSFQCASYATGRFGNALQFDGANDYVDAGNSSYLSPNQYSISLWVRNTSEITSEKSLVSKGTHNITYRISVLPNGTVRFAIQNATYNFSRAGSLALNLNDGPVYAAAIDPQGKFAYFERSGTVSPELIVKVNLTDFTRVTSLSLPSADGGSNGGTAIDPDGKFLYIGTGTSPGTIVKVRLSDFTRVGALTLNSGDGAIDSVIIDPKGEFLYAGNSGSDPGKIIKVRLSDFTRVGAVTLSSGEGYLRSATMDAKGEFAYFGTYTIAGRIVKINLTSFARVGAITLSTGEDNVDAAVIDPKDEFGYFGLDTSPGKVVKVNLLNFSKASTLTFTTDLENMTDSAIITPDGEYAYFGMDTFPGRLIRVRLSDFINDSVVVLNSGEDEAISTVVDPKGEFVYMGTYKATPTIAKIRLSDFTTTSISSVNALGPGFSHIVAVVNATSMGLYLNGNLEATASLPSVVPAVAGNLTIGSSGPLATSVGRSNSLFSTTFNGIIDDVAMYRRALSPEEINATYNAKVYQLYHNFTNLADGVYNYSAYEEDSFGNVNQTETRTITINTVYTPFITIQSPLNLSSYTSASIWFNITLNATGSWAGYSLDGAPNVTMTNSSGNWNNQNTSMSSGQHFVKFYANDTSGNMKTANVTFTINAAQPPYIFFVSPTDSDNFNVKRNWTYINASVLTASIYDGGLTDYQINISLDTQSLISAGKMQSTCSDIKVLDSDASTQLNYWIRSGCNTASTQIWIKVPNITSSKTIYLYYGDPAYSGNSYTGTMAVPPVSIWNYTINPSSNTGERVYMVASDSNNNIIAAGHDNITGKVRWRADKINATGSNVWTYNNSLTDSWNHFLYDIAVDSNDNIILGGDDYSSGASFAWRIEKLNSTGNNTWSYTEDISSGNDDVFGVAVDSAGNIFASGRDYDPGNWQLRVEKLNSTGNKTWSYMYNPSTGDDRSSGIALDSGNNSIIAGYDYVTGIDTQWRVEKINTTGNRTWAYQVNPSSIASDTAETARRVDVDSGDNALVVGLDKAGSGSTIRWRVEKINSGGSSVWTYISDPVSDNNDYSRSLTVDSDDNVIVSGTDIVPGNFQWRVEKLNSTGNNTWNYTSNPSSGTDDILGTALAKDALCYVLGGYDSIPGDFQWRVQKICERKLSYPEPTSSVGAEEVISTVSPFYIISPKGNATSWIWGAAS